MSDAAIPARAARRPRPRLARIAGAVVIAIALAAFLAPLIAPQDPTDLAALSLMDSLAPPAFVDGGTTAHLLGTDDQGRDILSAILYGTRTSLIVGVLSVALAAGLGVALGLVAGYAGGIVDAAIMRIADVQLTFPAILIALLIDGVARALYPALDRETWSLVVLVVAIGLSFWVQYARTVRGLTMVEARKDYVASAELVGLSSVTILRRHVLPNVMGPVTVLATLNLALAIVTEATLSFLGVGVAATEPSLGTLIRVGQDYLFSGEWWIAMFPAAMLVVLVLAVNVLGDALRTGADCRERAR